MQKILIKASVCALLVCALAASVSAAKLRVLNPLRLPDGQPLKAMYFYPHWWEPWKSDDAALSTDMGKIRDLGFNTICVDHEASQALDNDWGWINREYKFAREQHLQILPWLQLQAADRPALMKFSHLKLVPAVNQDRQPEDDYVSFYDKAFQEALAHYVTVYLDRYADDPAMLKVKIGDNVHPVVGLILETGWHDSNGLPLSFDSETNAYFQTWMKASHYDIHQLNKEWGTKYKSFNQIDPCDKTIFNYAADKAKMPIAVQEHVAFRARVINEALDNVAREVRKTHKDVLFVAEVPYPFGSSNPDAVAYHWNAASDMKAVKFSDIVFVRTMGDTISGEEMKDQDAILDSPKQVVTAYRLMGGSTQKEAIGLAVDAANAGNGIAYYNWNEQADNLSAVYDKPGRQTLLRTMNDVYDLLCNPGERHELAKAACTTVVPEADVKPAESGSAPTPAAAPANEGQIPPAPVNAGDIAPAVPTAQTPAPAAAVPAPSPTAAPAPAAAPTAAPAETVPAQK